MTDFSADKLSALDEVIKPLVWSEPHASVSYPNWYARKAAIQFEARIDTSRALCFGKFPLKINGMDCGQKHDTLEAAKAHAEARYYEIVSSLLSPAILAMAEREKRMREALEQIAGGKMAGWKSGEVAQQALGKDQA